MAGSPCTFRDKRQVRARRITPTVRDALGRVPLSRPDLEFYGLTHQSDAFGAQFTGAGSVGRVFHAGIVARSAGSVTAHSNQNITGTGITS